MNIPPDAIITPMCPGPAASCRAEAPIGTPTLVKSAARMKFLFDLFPVILFFAAFKLADIYVATGVAIAASFAQVGWLKLRRPEPIGARLNWSWVLFFVFMGAANLFVAFNYPTDLWVNFKLFGGTGLMLLFVIGQALYLARPVSEEPRAGAAAH